MTYMETLAGTPRPQRGEQHCNQRDTALIGVKLRLPGESWFTSSIADLSPTGFRLVSFVRLEPGAALWVMFPGFEGRRAKVVWSKDYESGCVFERPMHHAVLDYIVRKSGGGSAA